MPGECSMDWVAVVKAGTTLNHCRWKNPNLLVWMKHAPRTPKKTSLEIQWLSRLRSLGGLNFCHRTAQGTWRTGPISWATEMRYLQSAFVFSIRQQPKQGAAVQHIAELISAQIMLQSLKPHLNLVLSYGSLLGLALLLPVPHGDILVLSLSCKLSMLCRNSLPISES